jgi:hypothetical protein
MEKAVNYLWSIAEYPITNEELATTIMDFLASVLVGHHLLWKL